MASAPQAQMGSFWVFAHLNKSNDFRTALQILRLHSCGYLPPLMAQCDPPWRPSTSGFPPQVTLWSKPQSSSRTSVCVGGEAVTVTYTNPFDFAIPSPLPSTSLILLSFGPVKELATSKEKRKVLPRWELSGVNLGPLRPPKPEASWDQRAGHSSWFLQWAEAAVVWD